MTRAREAVLRLFRVSDNRAQQFEPKQAIFPGYEAPVILDAADGERELRVMNWGFILLQPGGKAPRRVTNVRDDKILTSKFWLPSFKERRCLVPVSSYCEPDTNKPAGWHWFTLKDDEEQRPLFAFPGIWRKWNGPIKKEGEAVEQEVFSFLTTTPNALTSSINHERMPCLLEGEVEHETWLKGSPDEAFGLVKSFAAERMRIVQSGGTKKDLLEAAA